jgi:hypothetical protein
MFDISDIFPSDFQNPREVKGLILPQKLILKKSTIESNRIKWTLIGNSLTRLGFFLAKLHNILHLCEGEDINLTSIRVGTHWVLLGGWVL